MDFRQTLLLVLIVLFQVGTWIVLMAALRRSRRRTLYSYQNAGLFGGALYAFFLLCNSVYGLCRSFTEDSLRTLISGMAQSVSDFIVYLLPFLFLLFTAVSLSNISLLRHEGRAAGNMLGVFMLFFFVGATALLLFGWEMVYQHVIFPLYLRGHQWIVLVDTAVPLFFGSLLCYLECVMLGVIVYSWKAALYQPPYDKDVIIILGCAIAPDGTPRPLLRGRIDRALAFAREQEAANGRPVLFVPSGGQGSDESISEAESMRRYLLAQGVPAERILPEDRSATTLENMRFSKALIDAAKPGANVIFSTTNYHVFRSGIYARQAGLDAEGIGSKTKLYFWPNATIREFVALMAARKRVHLTVAAALLAASLLLSLGHYWALFG